MVKRWENCLTKHHRDIANLKAPYQVWKINYFLIFHLFVHTLIPVFWSFFFCTLYMQLPSYFSQTAEHISNSLISGIQSNVNVYFIWCMPGVCLVYVWCMPGVFIGSATDLLVHIKFTKHHDNTIYTTCDSDLTWSYFSFFIEPI